MQNCTSRVDTIDSLDGAMIYTPTFIFVFLASEELQFFQRCVQEYRGGFIGKIDFRSGGEVGGGGGGSNLTRKTQSGSAVARHRVPNGVI